MVKFRDNFVKKKKLELIVYTNDKVIKSNINPLNTDAEKYTKIAKTDALKLALAKFNFDCAIGGARRDEEKSRAKERIFSFRDRNHIWDPKNQRPEFWSIFNTDINPDESVRVFPLSNWTETDIWQYIKLEKIDLVPLYFAKKRKVVEREGQIIMLDDNRFKLKKNEKISFQKIRFRTLGCYPLTAATLSRANSIDEIIKEVANSNFSERYGRLIDKNHQDGSMEKKKKEGYF
jgi:sulfate adenylyltransferase subunit 2